MCQHLSKHSTLINIITPVSCCEINSLYSFQMKRTGIGWNWTLLSQIFTHKSEEKWQAPPPKREQFPSFKIKLIYVTRNWYLGFSFPLNHVIILTKVPEKNVSCYIREGSVFARVVKTSLSYWELLLRACSLLSTALVQFVLNKASRVTSPSSLIGYENVNRKKVCCTMWAVEQH